MLWAFKLGWARKATINVFFYSLLSYELLGYFLWFLVRNHREVFNIISDTTACVAAGQPATLQKCELLYMFVFTTLRFTKLLIKRKILLAASGNYK